jgi:hypothetical protein
MILFPGFGRDLERAVRPVGEAEVFVRLTQASTNYVTLGERGFGALSALVQGVPRARSTIPIRRAHWRWWKSFGGSWHREGCEASRLGAARSLKDAVARFRGLDCADRPRTSGGR